MIEKSETYIIKCNVCEKDRSSSRFEKKESAIDEFISNGGIEFRRLFICNYCLDPYRKINRILGDFEFLLKIGGEFKESRTEEVDK